VHGFGRWILRRDGTPTGIVKLARCHLRGRTETELGYALLPGGRGQGYATEAGTGALAFATQTAGLTEVIETDRRAAHGHGQSSAIGPFRSMIMKQYEPTVLPKSLALAEERSGGTRRPQEGTKPTVQTLSLPGG
jgi:hypothetical protein